MLLAIKRLLNLVTKSKLTGKLDHINVESMPFWSEGKMHIKDIAFTAMEDFYSSITLEKLNQNTGEFEMDRAAIGVVIDMYEDPTRLNKYALVFKPKVDSKSTNRWEIEFEQNMRLDIDGTVFEIGDMIRTVYWYTLVKYNGLKKYTFTSDELLDVTLKSGQHVVGYIDTRLMYRRETDTIGIFDHTSLPLRMITGNSDTYPTVCIDLNDILSIEEMKEPYADSIILNKKPLEDTYAESAQK